MSSSIDQMLCKACHYPVTLHFTHKCVLQCKNCQQFHNSSSKFCPKYILQIEIIKLKETYGLFHQEASRRIKLLTQNKVHEVIEVCERENEEIDQIQSQISSAEKLESTIKFQEIKIQNLESKIMKIQEETHIRIKHIEDIRKANSEEENFNTMIDTIQDRNKYLDMKVEYLETFINSKRTVKAEYNKFKCKMEYEI